MSEYTKEPWVWNEHEFNFPPFEGTLEKECGIYPPLGESGPVAIAAGEANARRIVACVNACAGIPIEWVEAGAVDIIAHAQDLIKQRDALLSALKAIEFATKPEPDDGSAHENAYMLARAAIAAVEAE